MVTCMSDYDTEEVFSSIKSSRSDSYDSDDSIEIISLDDDDTYYSSVSSDYDADILYQLQVTNGLLGITIALKIILLALFIMVFFIKIIKNNVTNLID